MTQEYKLSFLKKIKESLRDPAKPKSSIGVQKPSIAKPIRKAVEHEYMDFSKAYRIGILCIYSETNDVLKQISAYKNKLDRMGYECEVLIFNNQQERNPNVYLPSFNLSDLNKDLLPCSPRSDRFMVRRFDLLLNLYFAPCKQLLYLSDLSNAKCRVSPYVDFFTPCSDILIPMSGQNNIPTLIKNINETLKIQPYVRPQV